MIELQAVTKTYAGNAMQFTALSNIALRICDGEYVAVVGKSGSGKSTLLNMLTGIDHPSAGRVVINGVDVHSLGESQLATWRGKSVGIVFQFFQLIPTLTILENILLAMEFVGVVPPKERQRRAGMLLGQVGIDPQANKLPSTLSGGEQQRAAIARALANDPPILVADEPTGNLDSYATQVVHGLFRQLVDAGKTVIVVTHDSSAGARFERVITLKDGKVDSDNLQTGNLAGTPV
jgi:putative ABC transport system ATP-binding protein